MSRIVLPIALCLLTISSLFPSIMGQVEQGTSMNSCIAPSAEPRNDFTFCFNPVVTIPLEKTWGGNSTDNPSRIALDRSGNIYMAGSTTSFGTNDSSRVFLVKYDSNGGLQWQRTWAANATSLYDMAIDPSGAAIYLTGGAKESCGFLSCKTGLVILKFDSSGQLQWQKLWLPDGSRGNGLAVDQSGNIYVAGSTPIPGSCETVGKNTLVFLKFNETGTLLLQNDLCVPGTTFGFQGLAVALDNVGDAYVLGADDGEWANFGACAVHSACNAVLFKFDSTGRPVWNVTIPGGYTPLYGSLKLSVDASGSIYVGGTTSGGDSDTPIQSPLTFYADIEKFSSSGEFQWGRYWGSNYDKASDTQGVGYSIATNSSGFSYVTGSTIIDNGQDKAVDGVLLLKFDPSGNLLSDMLWGPRAEAHSITLDATGNGYVAGSTLSYIGVQKLYTNIENVSNQGGGVCCATYFTNDTTGSVRGTVPCCIMKSTTLMSEGYVNGMVRSPAGVEAFTGKQGSFFFKYQESDVIKLPQTISLPPIGPIIVLVVEATAAIGAIAVIVTVVALFITRRKHRMTQPVL